jgi:hypothetical protein
VKACCGIYIPFHSYQAPFHKPEAAPPETVDAAGGMPVVGSPKLYFPVPDFQVLAWN